jgi:hypothetical protein
MRKPEIKVVRKSDNTTQYGDGGVMVEALQRETEMNIKLTKHGQHGYYFQENGKRPFGDVLRQTTMRPLFLSS